jgi:hypothetical protein
VVVIIVSRVLTAIPRLIPLEVLVITGPAPLAAPVLIGGTKLV